jgi:hypothetical protein
MCHQRLVAVNTNVGIVECFAAPHTVMIGPSVVVKDGGPAKVLQDGSRLAFHFEHTSRRCDENIRIFELQDERIAKAEAQVAPAMKRKSDRDWKLAQSGEKE